MCVCDNLCIIGNLISVEGQDLPPSCGYNHPLKLVTDVSSSNCGACWWLLSLALDISMVIPAV
jgi:hypothetical protein